MLEVKNLCKTYYPKKGVPVKALDDISVKLPTTGMVFVLGKSGSGKSTFLNVLGGLDRADGGEIIIKGKSSKDFSQGDFDSYRNTYLGFIFQEYNILDEFTVGANIALAIELQGRKAKSQEVNDIMKSVDLDGYGSRKPNELSGGQKQRVAIARALVKSPEIIMADEPTGALDSKTGKQVFDTLRNLSKEKLVLVVSHDRDFAEIYGDRVIEFADGKIISDTEKTLVKGTEKSSGVSVINEKIIHVKKGYSLTQADIKMISEYIAKASDDVLISLDKKTNVSVKEISKITDDGEQETFIKTNQDVIKLDGDSKFSLIKSRLSLKHSMKMGASALKVKPFRLLVTILLSFIAFGMFGLADTMGAYNKVTTTINSMVDSNVTSTAFSKIYQVERNGWVSEGDLSLDDNDLSLLKEKTGNSFYGVYAPKDFSYSDISIENNVKDHEAIDNGYYLSSISGFIDINQNVLNSLSFTLDGNLPSSDSEVVITEYMYSHFAVGGYTNEKDKVNLTAEDVNSHQSIIGKKINVGSEVYTISGVIDTKLSTDRYESLKKNNPNGGLTNYLLVSEFQTVINQGFHSILFTHDGYTKSLVDKDKTVKGVSTGGSSFYINVQKGPYSSDYRSFGPSRVIKEADGKDQITYINGNTSLGDYGVAINAFMLLDYVDLDSITISDDDKFFGFSEEDKIYRPEGITEFYELTDKYIRKAISDYATANYKEALEKGFTPRYDEYLYNPDIELSDEEKENIAIEQFSDYLSWGDGRANNAYTSKTGSEIEVLTRKNLYEKYDVLNKANLAGFNLDYSNYITEVEKTLPFELKGVYYAEPDEYGYIRAYDTDFYVGNKLYEELVSFEDGYYEYALTSINEQTDLHKLVDFIYDGKVDLVKFNASNEVQYLLDQVNSIIEVLAVIFLWVGVGFAVFASLLLLNFITISISYKKREIGILRAVGARSSDVFRIFFCESLIITLINFVLATATCITLTIVINSVLRTNYGILITILNFGVRQIGLILAISILVALVSSFFPVFKIARKKPIDAINNR